MPLTNSLPLIIGHRGASAVAPENTFAAFDLAMDAGAHGIEFDVRLSSDGIPICIHDETLQRTGKCNLKVAEMSARELTTHDVGSWFNKRHTKLAREVFMTQTVPPLERVLSWARERNALLYLELKTVPGNAYTLAAHAARLVLRHKLTEQVFIESFDHSAVRAIKQINSTLKTAALFERSARRLFPTDKYIADAAKRCEADEVALHYTLATPKIIETAHRAGLDVVVWTVDETAWIERARLRQIKALITNDPAAMLGTTQKLIHTTA